MNDLRRILVVEDDENDLFLLKRAFHAIGYAGDLIACSTVDDAIEFILGHGGSCGRAEGTAPQIIITDLKLGGLSGFDFLRWLKDNPDFRVTPTVVLSSSDAETDVNEAYILGANAYMVKPCEPESLREILDTLIEFWRLCEEPIMVAQTVAAVPAVKAPVSECRAAPRLRRAFSEFPLTRGLQLNDGFICLRRAAGTPCPAYRAACA